MTCVSVVQKRGVFRLLGVSISVSDHPVSPAPVMRGCVKQLKHKSGSWKTWPLFLRLSQPVHDFG